MWLLLREGLWPRLWSRSRQRSWLWLLLMDWLLLLLWKWLLRLSSGQGGHLGLRQKRGWGTWPRLGLG